jgi:hypothetical protein
MPLKSLHVVFIVASILIPDVADACPVCFGAVDGLMLRGSNMGILALLVVTLAVLGAFGAFFFSLARRAAQVQEPDSPAASGRGDRGELGRAVR